MPKTEQKTLEYSKKKYSQYNAILEHIMMQFILLNHVLYNYFGVWLKSHVLKD